MMRVVSTIILGGLVIGMTGCELYVSLDILQAFPTTSAGATTIHLGIPNLAALLGVPFHCQVAVIDLRANSFGLAWSNAGTATIGGN